MNDNTQEKEEGPWLPLGRVTEVRVIKAKRPCHVLKHQHTPQHPPCLVILPLTCLCLSPSFPFPLYIHTQTHSSLALHSFILSHTTKHI